MSDVLESRHLASSDLATQPELDPSDRVLNSLIGREQRVALRGEIQIEGGIEDSPLTAEVAAVPEPSSGTTQQRSWRVPLTSMRDVHVVTPVRPSSAEEPSIFDPATSVACRRITEEGVVGPSQLKGRSRRQSVVIMNTSWGWRKEQPAGGIVIVPVPLSSTMQSSPN